MALNDPIRKIIQAVLDVASFRKMETEAQRALDKGTDPAKAKKNLSAVERAIEGLKGTALKVGVALGGLFALDKLKDFAAASVRAAAESEESWTRLAGTLTNIGVNAEQQQSRIEALAAQFQAATRFDDEGFQDALQTLIRLTGDYEGSLQHVSLAADLAVGANVDLNTAAQLLGRALNGDTSMLKRYGIEVRAGKDVTEELRRVIGGLAEKDGKTLGSWLERIVNDWGNFKEAVGNAIAEAGGGTSVLETLSGAIKGATAFVEQNQESLTNLGRVIRPVIGFLGFLAKVFLTVADSISGHWDRAVGASIGVMGLWTKGQALASRALATFLEAIGADDAAKRIREHTKEISEQADEYMRLANARMSAAKASEQRVASRFGIGGAAPLLDTEGSKEQAESAGRVAVEQQMARNAESPAKRAQQLEANATELEQLTKGLQLRSLTAQETRRLAQVERDLRREREAGNLTLDQRNAVEEKLQALAAARKQAVDEARGAEDKRTQTVERQVAALARLGDLHALTIPDLRRIMDLESATARELDRGNLSYERRLALLQRQQELQATLARSFGAGLGREGTLASGFISAPAPTEVPKVDLSGLQPLPVPDPKVRDAWLDTAETFRSAFADAFGAVGQDASALEAVLGGVGAALGQAIASGEDFSEIASQHAKMDLARAVEEGALALASLAIFDPRGAAQHGAAATAFGVAAAAWAALGAATGGGHHGQHAGAGAAGGASAAAARAPDRPQPPGPDVKIVLMGDFDALNPRVQAVIYKGHQYARERFGEGANIIDVRPGVG